MLILLNRKILLVHGENLPGDMADSFVAFAVSHATCEDGSGNIDYLELLPELKKKDGKGD